MLRGERFWNRQRGERKKQKERRFFTRAVNHVDAMPFERGPKPPSTVRIERTVGWPIQALLEWATLKASVSAACKARLALKEGLNGPPLKFEPCAHLHVPGERSASGTGDDAEGRIPNAIVGEPKAFGVGAIQALSVQLEMGAIAKLIDPFKTYIEIVDAVAAELG